MRLGSRIWNDLDDDGLYEPASSEVGIAGVVVELLDSTGMTVLLTTTTDASGYFAFTNIGAGAYRLRVPGGNFDGWTDPLYGFVSSSPTFSADDTVDDNDSGLNNADPANGGVTSGLVTLTVGGEPIGETDEDGAYPDANSNLTVDFGFFELLTLGNRIWFDADEDGVIDPLESGAPPGVVVNLLDASNNPIPHPVTGLPITASTNISGAYQFTDLYPGDYVVQIAPQNFQPGGLLLNYISSAGGVDPDDDDNGDDNGVDGGLPAVDGIRSFPITLNYRTEPAGGSDGDDNSNTNLSVDFGLVIDPTAVELLYFRVESLNGLQVTLGWATAMEIDHFGFKLYRSATSNFADAELIHFEPAPIVGGNPDGAAYVYTDPTPGAGVWWYWLSDVDVNGLETFHPEVATAYTGQAQMPFILFLPVIRR